MKKIIFILSIISTFFAQKSFATHTAGGELIYDLVPGTTNQYQFTFKFYRACAYWTGTQWSTSSGEPNSFTMCYFNSCSPTTYSLVLNKVVGNITPTPPNPPVPNGTVMGNGCDSIVTLCSYTPPSSAPAGTQPGYEEWWYQGTVTLPTTCNFWKFYVQLCCRNNGIQNIVFGGTPGNSGGANIYVEATLDNSQASVNSNLNSSARFTYNGSPTSIPIPYICVNSPYVHNGGGMDPDGDSLVYETIDPRHQTACTQAVAQNILYNVAAGGPYNILNTGGNPIACGNTYNLNPNNGVFTLTPTTLGQWVISQKISEYRNGVLVGTVMRDMQFVVDNCVPMAANTLLDSLNITGGTALLDTVRTCPGANLNFCFDIFSPNGIYILPLFDNHVADFPGSSITYSNLNDSTLHACMTWVPAIADTGINILSVTVKDSLNCQTAPSTVQLKLWVNKDIRTSNDTTICQGQSTQFQTFGNGSYNWIALPGGSGTNSLSCTNCPNPIATPNVTTTYVVLDTMCNFTDTVTVTIIPAPSLTITPDTTTCINSTLQLGVTVNNPLPTGSYSYNWAPATYLNNTTIPNPTVNNPTNPISYTVTVTSTILACPATASVDVDVLLGFKLANSDTTICDGDDVQINVIGGNPKYTYSWNPATFVSNPASITPIIAPTPSGVYPYTVTASFPGCPDTSDDIAITVEPLPIVNAGVDEEICKGDTVHLLGAVTPPSNLYTYLWTPGADLNVNDVLNPIFDGLTSTTLTLSATTPMGCKGEDIMQVTVRDVDFLIIDGNRTLCPRDTTILSVVGGFNYYWWPKEYIINDQSSTITVQPINTTDYYVAGTDIKGCRDTVHATVVVNPEGIIFTGDDKTIYPGESVMIEANGNCSLNFNWFPPNGLSASNIKNPIAQPSVTTQYIVTAETEGGCKAIDTIVVYVSEETLVELPNAFSPGSGTSINDELKPIIKGIAKMNYFKIYNRWGQEVFSSTDINKGWNGQFNGKPQPMATYVYMLDIVTISGKRVQKKGNVTLIR
ncbi:MAG: gliding motility-associated C-terminal domain-containing protein [Chitinophagaceae bacterium]